MRKGLGRELLWLSLPVVLLGGVAFYQGRTGRWRPPHFFNPFDNGPRRIELTPFEEVELKPIDVAKGYDWATKTTMGTVGKLDVPQSWRNQGESGVDSNLRLVYRKGAVWKRAPLYQGSSPLTLVLSGSPFSGPIVIQAKLKSIPRDADEVRLQGALRYIHLYRGAIPSGWVSPKNVRHAGLSHLFTISSGSIDVPIKSEGGKWPRSVVSKQEKIEVIGGVWLRDEWGDNRMLRVRAKPDSGLAGELHCRLDDVEYFDADGKPISVFQDATSTTPTFPQGSKRGYMNYNIADNEDIVRLDQTEAQPRRGWDKVKMPITVTGLVSDGECWPTAFKVRLRPERGSSRDYGASAQPDTR